jgi:hypothetical protein
MSADTLSTLQNAQIELVFFLKHGWFKKIDDLLYKT